VERAANVCDRQKQNAGIHAADSKKRRPDFVYDPAGKYAFPAKSVIVAEAKGSLSRQRAKRAAIRRLSRKAFTEQVQHVIGKPARDVIIAGGYGIAFGAIPGEHIPGAAGEQVSTLAVASPEAIAVIASKEAVKLNSLSAAATYGAQQVQKTQQQQVPQQHRQEVHLQHERTRHGPGGPGGPGGPDGGGSRGERERRTASGRIAYANYESAFLMCGATNVAAFLRSMLDGRGIADMSPESSFEEFWIVEHRKGPFWIARSGVDRWWPCWRPEPFYFAMHDTSAKQILHALASNLERVPDSIELTAATIDGDLDPADDEDIALQGDGLALLTDVHASSGPQRWDLRQGKWV